MKKLNISKFITKIAPMLETPLLENRIRKGVKLTLKNVKESYDSAETKFVRTKNEFNKNIKTIVDFKKDFWHFNKSFNPTLESFSALKLNSVPTLPKLEEKKTKKMKKIMDRKERIKNLKLFRKEKAKNHILTYSRVITPFDNFSGSQKYIVYHFNKLNKVNYNIKNLYTILNGAFLKMSSLISKPMIHVGKDRIFIQLFYYWHPNLRKNKFSFDYSRFLIINRLKIKKLLVGLRNYYKKPISLELTRLYNVHQESNMLANLLGLMINTIKFRYIQKRLFSVLRIVSSRKIFDDDITIFDPSFLSGIRIKLAGRILGQKLKNRVKSRTIQKGSLSRIKADFVSKARFTNKNKKGAFSITINTGHFFLK